VIDDEDDDEAEFEEEVKQPQKKQKKVPGPSTTTTTTATANENPEERIFSLGQKKKISLSKFKGKVYVNIREYYTDDSGVDKVDSCSSLTHQQNLIPFRSLERRESHSPISNGKN
jgi:hypothetical protein